MAEITLVAEPGRPTGSAAVAAPPRRRPDPCRGLRPRRAGTAVSVDGRDLRHALSGEAGLNQLLSLEVGSETHLALARACSATRSATPSSTSTSRSCGATRSSPPTCPIVLVGEAKAVEQETGRRRAAAHHPDRQRHPGPHPAQPRGRHLRPDRRRRHPRRRPAAARGRHHRRARGRAGGAGLGHPGGHRPRRRQARRPRARSGGRGRGRRGGRRRRHRLPGRASCSADPRYRARPRTCWPSGSATPAPSTPAPATTPGPTRWPCWPPGTGSASSGPRSTPWSPRSGSTAAAWPWPSRRPT